MACAYAQTEFRSCRHLYIAVLKYGRRQKKFPIRSVQRAPVKKKTGGERELNGNLTGDERNGPFRTNSRLILISPFPFSGMGEYTHARMSRVLFLSRVLLLEAQQEQTSKLRIFLIKLSHSSSTYENTFAFQHFIDRRRTIIFGLKERAIPFAYSVRTVLGSSHSSSVIWRLFNVLTPSLYSVRCLTVLVLLSFVLKLTTPIGFD